jgi:hypothetical protein
VTGCSGCFPKDADVDTGCYPGAVGYPTAAQTEHTITGLRADKYYAFQIAAFNHFGQGPYSDASYAVHTHAAPTAPTDVTKASETVDGKSVTLTWTAGDAYNEGTDVCAGNTLVTAGSFVGGSKYTIVSPGDTDFTLITAADSLKGTTFTADAVGSGTGTAVLHRAAASYACSKSKNKMFEECDTDFAGAGAGVLSAGEATACCASGAAASLSVATFDIEECTTAGYAATSYATTSYTVTVMKGATTVATATSASATATITGLSSNTAYTATVTTTNLAGTGAASTALSWTSKKVPDAPTVPEVSAVTDNTMSLKWTAAVTAAQTGQTAASEPGQLGNVGVVLDSAGTVVQQAGFKLYAQSCTTFAGGATARGSHAVSKSPCTVWSPAVRATLATDGKDNIAETENALGNTVAYPTATQPDVSYYQKSSATTLDDTGDGTPDWLLLTYFSAKSASLAGTTDRTADTATTAYTCAANEDTCPVDQVTVPYLAAGTTYRFKLVFYNAVGDSVGGAISSEYTTLDKAIADVKIYSGAPCVYKQREHGPVVTAGAFVIGETYKIQTTGDTDYTGSTGAADSSPGTVFEAGDAGTGTGTAYQYLVERDGSPTTSDGAVTFAASAAGTNVKYRWQISEHTETGTAVFNSGTADDAGGSKIGKCVDTACSVMEFEFPYPGVDTTVANYDEIRIKVIASNTRGIVTQTVGFGYDLSTHDLNTIEYCGCTDNSDANYWPQASFHVPDECAGKSTFAANAYGASTASEGEWEYFQFFFTGKAYSADVVLRVDTGKVDMYVSAVSMPDPGRTASYYVDGYATGTTDAAKVAITGVTNFYVAELPYKELALSGASYSVFVAVKGAAPFSRFQVVGDSKEFNTPFTHGEAALYSSISTYKRAQLKDITEDADGITSTINAGEYDFFEFFYPHADNDLDVELDLLVTEGEATLYTSRIDPYPSPDRATLTNTLGYWGPDTGTCANCHTGKIAAGSSNKFVYTIKPSDQAGKDGILYIGVMGAYATGHNTGEVLQRTTYNLKAKVYRYRIESDLLEPGRPVTAAKSTQVGTLASHTSDATGGEVETADRYSVVTEDNFNYYEVKLSKATFKVTCTMKVHYGTIGVYTSKLGLPTQDKSLQVGSVATGAGTSTTGFQKEYTTSDGEVVFELEYGLLNMVDGYVYIGLIGRGGEASYDLKVSEDTFGVAAPRDLYWCSGITAAGGTVGSSAACTHVPTDLTTEAAKADGAYSFAESAAPAVTTDGTIATTDSGGGYFFFQIYIGGADVAQETVARRSGPGSRATDISTPSASWGNDWTEPFVNTWKKAVEFDLDLDVVFGDGLTGANFDVYLSASEMYPSEERCVTSGTTPTCFTQAFTDGDSTESATLPIYTNEHRMVYIGVRVAAGGTIAGDMSIIKSEMTSTRTAPTTHGATNVGVTECTDSDGLLTTTKCGSYGTCVYDTNDASRTNMLQVTSAYCICDDGWYGDDCSVASFGRSTTGPALSLATGFADHMSTFNSWDQSANAGAGECRLGTGPDSDLQTYGATAVAGTTGLTCVAGTNAWTEGSKTCTRGTAFIWEPLEEIGSAHKITGCKALGEGNVAASGSLADCKTACAADDNCNAFNRDDSVICSLLQCPIGGTLTLVADADYTAHRNLPHTCCSSTPSDTGTCPAADIVTGVHSKAECETMPGVTNEWDCLVASENPATTAPGEACTIYESYGTNANLAITALSSADATGCATACTAAGTACSISVGTSSLCVLYSCPLYSTATSTTTADVSVADGNFVVGDKYQIIALGTTTQGEWAAAGVDGTAGVGSVFVAAGVGASGTGTASDLKAEVIALVSAAQSASTACTKLPAVVAEAACEQAAIPEIPAAVCPAAAILAGITSCDAYEQVSLDCTTMDCTPSTDATQKYKLGYVSCTNGGAVCMVNAAKPVLTIPFSVTNLPANAKVAAYVDGKPYPSKAANTIYYVNNCESSDAACKAATTATTFADSSLKIYDMKPLSAGIKHTAVLMLLTDSGQPLGSVQTSFEVGYGGGCEVAPDGSVCGGRGSCYEGYCVCYDGYYGASCGRVAAEDGLACRNAASSSATCLAASDTANAFTCVWSATASTCTASFTATGAFTAGGEYEKRKTALTNSKLGEARFLNTRMLEATSAALTRSDAAMVANTATMKSNLDTKVAATAATIETTLAAVQTKVDTLYSKSARNAVKLQQAREESLRLQTKNLEEKLDMQRSLQSHQRLVQNRLDTKRFDAYKLNAIKQDKLKQEFARSRFTINQLKTANGPLVNTAKFSETECTADQFYRVGCTEAETDKSSLYKGSGYVTAGTVDYGATDGATAAPVVAIEGSIVDGYYDENVLRGL